jgi:hypothetical protein
MNPRLLVGVLVVLYGVTLPQVVAQQPAARKKQPVVKQQPRGEYERLDVLDHRQEEGDSHETVRATALSWKILQVAESTFRRLKGAELLPAVYAGARSVDGRQRTMSAPQRVAA